MKIRFLILFMLIVKFSVSQEICNNGIDDDGDGLVDLNDISECFCQEQTIVPSSLIPNPSFENNICCPSPFDDMVCLNSWIQASTATTDHFDLCGWTHIAWNSPPQAPITGNGTGYVGYYSQSFTKEYAGACLSGSLIAGASYSISFYTAWGLGDPATDIGLFGATNCTSLPWNDNDCPSAVNGWQLLSSQSVTHTTDGAWQQVTLTFTPSVNINAISLGPTCNTTGYGNYYLDALTLNESSLFSGVSLQGSFCTGDAVLSMNIINSSNYQWYKDGIALPGETDSLINLFNYPFGDYAITYTNNGICRRIEYDYTSPLNPSLIVTSDSICVGEETLLFGSVDQSTIPIVNSFFDFQDGSAPQNSLFTAKQFVLPGSYNSKFVVVGNNGCRDSVVAPIDVFSIPEPAIEFSNNGTFYQPAEGDTVLVCGTDSLYFNDLTMVLAPSQVSSYEWGFGDLTTSSVQNPVKKYSAFGFYKVEFIVETNKGCSDTMVFVINLVPGSQPNFLYNVSNCENDLINFTNASTTVLPSTISTYLWSFGDQIQSTIENPEHSYQQAGIYNVKLLVENTNGCLDSISQQITIHPNPTANFQVLNYCQNETISFTDFSVVSGGTIDNYDWQFGDGNSSSNQNTTHQYDLPHTYTIELIVESDQGCKDTLDSLITISPAPIAEFYIEDDCQNELIQAVNNSSISIGSISQNWSFENNINSTLENPPAVIYTNAGTYQVTLVASSEQGCTDSINQNLIIHPIPEAIINESPLEGCSPFEVSLSHAQDNNISNCIWDLGDGTVKETCGTIFHKYDAGVFDVELLVFSSFGCENSILMSDFINVEQSPKASFSYSPGTVTVKLNEVQFKNESTGASDFVWDFNSGLGASVDEDPNFTFPSIANVYSVSLAATSSSGNCTDMVTQNIKIFDELIFYVPNSFTPNRSGPNDMFLPVMTAGYNLYTYQLTIYNRNGEIVFVSKDPQVGWDGTYVGNQVQMGVYAWKIDYQLITVDQTVTEYGTVNVLR
ncbi:MAG: PKD domain-containing protein [Crocinitomicaceae bacterium]